MSLDDQGESLAQSVREGIAALEAEPALAPPAARLLRGLRIALAEWEQAAPDEGRAMAENASLTIEYEDGTVVQGDVPGGLLLSSAKWIDWLIAANEPPKPAPDEDR